MAWECSVDILLYLTERCTRIALPFGQLISSNTGWQVGPLHRLKAAAAGGCHSTRLLWNAGCIIVVLFA